jgi:TorA maturation chaperone TorD
MARHSLYSGLAHVLMPPDPEIEASLDTGEFFFVRREWLSFLPEATELGTQIESFQCAWERDAREADVDLVTRYHRVFGHSLSPDYPPYGVQYGPATPFQQSERLADLVGMYRTFGLELSPHAKERPDHLGIMLEFAGFLAAKEAYHIEQDQATHLQATEAAGRHFLVEFLGPGVLSFASRFVRRGPDGFYKEAARFAEAVVRWDAWRLGLSARVANPLDLVAWGRDDADVEWEEVGSTC